MQQDKKFCYECIHKRCKSRLIFPEDVDPVECKKYKKAMEKIIAVKRNRDGATVWFEHVEGTTYKIDASKKYVLEYACVNYDPLPDNATEFDSEFKFDDGHTQKAHLVSFDPSGGPYITIGETYEGYEVKRIFTIPEKLGTFFTLEKINK